MKQVGLFSARTENDAAGLCAGVFAISQNLATVDKNVFDPGAELMRVLKGRMILNGVGVEHDHVSKESWG